MDLPNVLTWVLSAKLVQRVPQAMQALCEAQVALVNAHFSTGPTFFREGYASRMDYSLLPAGLLTT